MSDEDLWKFFSVFLTIIYFIIAKFDKYLRIC